MAEISKQALKVANNTEFPNNNAGAITPSRLRGFNTDMIDSLVDEISYTADSASWEQSIAALEAFTGSAQSLTTGSLLITASANLNTITFTKGNGSTFDVLINTGSDATDLGPLNAFTASVAGTNAFTQSANLRLNSLEATTASLNTSVSNLNGFTQSIQTEVDNIQAVTASYATTGSNTFVGNQTIVGSVSASSFVSASRFIGDGSQITGITASVATTILNDGVLQGTATSLNFTGSGVNATVVAGVAIIQSEVDQSVLDRYTTTASFNSYTQSTDAKINSINGFTASVAGTNTFTASIAGTNTFTASLAGTNAFTESANSRLTALENTSASVDISVSALNGFTASVAGTNAFTASIAGTNSFTASIAGTNAFTQSADQRLDSIEAQSGSWVTAAITASSLVTASAAGSDITFTKGDNTQFTITVATGSVVSASYAENSATASLARSVIVSAVNANQSTLPIGTVVRISGANGDNPQFNTASYTDEVNSSNTLGVLANTAVSGDYGDVTVIGKLVGINTDGMNAGDLLYLSSSGQFTNVAPQAPLQIVVLGEVLRVQSNNGSMFVNVSNGWELNELHNVRITSVAQGDLLVYEASSSLWKNQPSSSFVKIEQTGSFATTGSNTFLGDEIFSGNIDVRDNIYAGYIDMRDDGGIFFRASGSNVVSGSAEYWSQASQFQVGDMVFVQQPSNDKVMSLGLDNRYVTFYKGIDLEPGFQGVDVYSTPLILSSSFGGQTEILDVKGNVSASNLNLSGALTASILEGYALVGGVGNVSKLVATSSFGGGQTFERPSLVSVSGSLGIVANTFTSGAANFAHISASADNQANLVFKPNNNTATTIISGSGNIYTNPTAPTATFVRYMSVGNLAIGSTIGGSGQAVPQISASMAWSPTISNNVFASSVLPLQWRGPVSASASSVSNNVLAGGQIVLGPNAASSFTAATIATGISNNLLAGSVTAAAFKTPLSASVIMNNNIIGGGATLNMDSSSISFSGNSIQGGLTVNNSYFPTTYTSASATLGVNGGLYIGSHTIYASGSNATLTSGRTVSNAVMMGTANVISASLNGDNAQVASTILLGQSLVAIGSNTRAAGATAADWGSVFVGRWNSDLGTADTTAETVFAVGTGTSNTTRKTGLLIDSGSNTFIEGTLNVSGSTTITGSLTISGSAQSDLTVVGQIFVSSSAATSTTAPRITVSGSAGRTVINRNSINTFDTTDEGGMYPSTIYTRDSATFDEIGFTVDPSVFLITGWSTGPAIYINNPTDTYPTVIGFQNKANYTDGRVTVLTPLVAKSGSVVEGTLNVSGSTSMTGSTTMSGSLNVFGDSSFTGSMNFLSGSASGSVITNVGDTFTGTAAVTKIISLSSAEYTALSPKDPNTLYIIV